jgi:hypothetical protein
MSLDLDSANRTLGGLRPFPVAVTTVADGRANGLMSLSAGAAAIVPEAPRVTISLTKYNKTHDMVVASGVFAMHLLAKDPDIIDASLAIIMGLGGSSGRDGDKLSPFSTKPGVTGVPILSLDAEESTIFVADVVGAETLREGSRLNIGEAWSKLPAEWIERYEANHVPQVDNARRNRGLIP